MARSQNPLTGRMSGGVGNFVTSTYRGQNVIRSKAFTHKDANSDAQKKHRSLFKELSGVYASFASLVADGFPGRPKNQSPYNAFIAANLSEAVDRSGEIPEIDYSRLVLSKGTLPLVNVTSTLVGEDGLTIHYTTLSGITGAASDDVVMAVLKTTEGYVYSASKPRGTNVSDSVVLASSDTAVESVSYIYLMVVSANKTKASQTVYVPVN